MHPMSEELTAYKYLRERVLKGAVAFADPSDPPIEGILKIYRTKVGKTWQYGATCGPYHFSSSGKWLVNFQVRPHPQIQ
jgi:hypothetical protein